MVTTVNGAPFNSIIYLNGISINSIANYMGATITPPLPDYMYLVGAFQSYKSPVYTRILRTDLSGNVDTTFNMGAGANNNVLTMVTQSDGKILIGGLFTAYSGSTNQSMVRINTNGTKDTTFNIGSNGFNGNVYDIQDNLQLKGNLKHFVIPPYAASQLTGFDPQAQLCCEVLARNIGIRRAEGDYIVSTNIDIIHPKRKDIEDIIESNGDDIMITLSRREVTWDIIKEFHGGELKYNEWDKLREHIYINSEKRVVKEKTNELDDYSIINCCGDFQIASKQIWNEIRGFEEELIYPLFADTNVQKKAVIHGFKLKVCSGDKVFPAFFSRKLKKL